MPNRLFSQNTSCSEHTEKSSKVAPLDASLVGHVIKVYADFAIHDSTTGNYILPEQMTTAVAGVVKRGLVQ